MIQGLIRQVSVKLQHPNETLVIGSGSLRQRIKRPQSPSECNKYAGLVLRKEAVDRGSRSQRSGAAQIPLQIRFLTSLFKLHVDTPPVEEVRNYRRHQRHYQVHHLPPALSDLPISSSYLFSSNAGPMQVLASICSNLRDHVGVPCLLDNA